MQHRIFIAIKLPDDIRREVMVWQDNHRDLAMHWVGPESLHITVVFFGYVDDDQLDRLREISRQVVGQFEPMEIEFEKITYGTNYDIKPRDLSILRYQPPRLVWLMGLYSERLEQMQQKLASALLRVASPEFYERDRRHFKPHITLGRTDERRWRQQKEILWIDDKMPMKFIVKSVEIMESRLYRSGAEYQVVESIELNSSTAS